MSRSAKISIFRGEGVLCISQNSKCQDLPKFQFSRGRGGGGSQPNPRKGCSCQFEQKFYLALTLSGGPWITDSVEANEFYSNLLSFLVRLTLQKTPQNINLFYILVAYNMHQNHSLLQFFILIKIPQKFMNGLTLI